MATGTAHLAAGRWILTSGSVEFQDAVYSLAALRPSSLSSLSLAVLALAFVASICLVWFLFREAPEQGAKSLRRPRTEARRYLSAAALVMLLAIHYFMILDLTMTALAIHVHRVYQANIETLTPYLPEAMVSTFNTQFAAMRTKRDFDAIQAKMAIAADRSEVRLRPEW